jgi:hypothetical protein
MYVMAETAAIKPKNMMSSVIVASVGFFPPDSHHKTELPNERFTF